MDPRLEAAIQTYREDGAAKALPEFEKLAGEFSTGRRKRDHAAAQHYLGECHWRLGNFSEAHQYLDLALALERASGDRLSEGKTLNVLGLLSWDEGHYDLAIADFRKAGTLARELRDKKLEGSSLNNLSLVYDELGDYDTSLRQYRQVLELYRGADFPRGIGDTLGNIGGVHLLLGHYREALDYYQQALTISERLKSTTSMSQDHGNIALSQLGLGEVDAALVHLDRAIDLARKAGMQQDQAYWLRVKSDALVEKGRYDLALQDYREALAVYEKIGARAELAEALNRFGQLQLLLGDTASAERDFKRALELARSIGLARGVTLNLIALGDLANRREQPEAAVALYEQARQRAAAVKAQHALALSQLRLARVHRSLQDLPLAAKETGEALAIGRTIGAADLVAEALYSRAEVARLQKEFGAALANYAAAERADARIGDPDLLWQLQFGRARAHEARGDPAAALVSLEAAIGVIEGVRGRLQEPRFRSGYVEDKFEVYLELMRLQIQQGKAADAFTTAERLRARVFAEQLGGRTTVPLTTNERRTEAELRERVRKLQQALAEMNDDGRPAYPERALDRFSQELSRAETEYQAFLDDHARLHASAVAAPSASSVQERLSADEALLEYVVGPEGLFVFVVDPSGLTVQSVPVRQLDLVARISLLRDLINRPGDDQWRKPAARLAAELIEPLEQAGRLEGVKRLYIVPHGALTYLPFALLPGKSAGKNDLLIDRYAIAYLPAAAALLRAPSNPDRVTSVLAVAPARGGLRYAPEEARVVDALFRPNSRTLIGAEATEARFKQLAGGYRMLHLATHGRFNVTSPLLSGLELEPGPNDDGMLRVDEILDLRLRADLVTLSACDTALGSGYFADLPAGDEFIGLNRAFLAAGSASVLATLWRVDDRASLLLMQRFYGHLSGSARQKDFTHALALAQRSMRASPGLAHPYFWAAYAVIGGSDNAEVTVADRSTGRRS